MAEINYDFTANEQSALQSLARLERQYDKLENSIKNTSRSSRRGARDAESGLQRQASQLTRVVSGYLTATTAVTALSSAYQQWATDIDEVALKLADTNQSLTETLAGAGFLAQGPQLREFFQNLEGVTQQQAQDIFGAVAGAAPNLNAQRVQGITRAVAPLEGVRSEQQVANIAAIAGNLGQVLQGRSDEDLADLAVTISARLGDRAGQARDAGFERSLRTLTEQGVQTEEALAFLTAGIEAGGQSRQLAGIGGRLRPGQTLADVFGGRVELGREQQDLINLIDPAAVQQIQQEFIQAQAGNVVAELRSQAAAVNAPGLARQIAAATEEDTLRQQAEDLDRLRAFQELRRSQATGLRRTALQGIDLPLVGNVGVESAEERVLRSGTQDVLPIGATQQFVRQSQTEESLELLRRIASGVEQRQLNRHANQEVEE